MIEKIEPKESQNLIKFVSQPGCINVYLDQNLLEPIIKNLLDNAIKYSPRGSPINFQLSGDQEQIVIQIEDQGMGMTTTDKQRIFDPFYQCHRSHHPAGNGLELAIVKALVDLHHGQVSVESEIDVGSIFTVILPTRS
ncbi:sensor histidine kinase [Fortiea contorta]|uniref:sensor histidine kinase n=1 Tax=Fortiea contorta TaxID=1892405 RepID=UPI00034A8CC0|nr:ATP-binding protein [Fortiea contorta]